MKAVIRIESRNDDAYQAGKMLVSGQVDRLPNRRKYMMALRELQTPRGVYRVLGFTGDVPLRQPQRGVKDYTFANSSGSRGVFIEYIIGDGAYVVFEPPKPRRYIIVRDGEVIDTTVDGVKSWLK